MQPATNTALANISRAFYGIGIAALGIQQFMYKDFRPVILSPSPEWMHNIVLAYISGAAMVLAGILILLNKKARVTALLTGSILLLFFLAFQCTYVLFVQPNNPQHLGLWIDPLKEFALSGGAFIVAGISSATAQKNSLYMLLEKFIPLGKFFFCTTMITFGMTHFLYADFVKTLVPSWAMDPVFWTYFAGVALMASGIAIALKIRVKRIAALLSIMLLLWVILLHIPRAIADPTGLNGNEITSVFEALAFSGIALGIMLLHKSMQQVEV